MSENTAPALLPIDGAGDPWWAAWSSYELHLDAEQRSPRTLLAYKIAADQFHRYLVEHNAPTDPLDIRRQHVESFVVYLRDQLHHKPATIKVRFMALHGFFAWLVDEQEIETSPMARMKAPVVDEPPPELISDDQLAALFRACAGTGFHERRDTALIGFLLDTGLRRSEALAVRLDTINLHERFVQVVRKGNHAGIAFFGAKTARDIDRYLRVRSRHPHRESPYLWVGEKGQFGDEGLRYMLNRRAREAGITFNVHPHAFRHAFADALKSGGASDEDVMTAGGWRDPKVMRRYAAARSLERARDTHRRLSPRDRL